MREFFDLSHAFDENTYHPFGFASFQNIQMYSSHGCRHARVTMSLHFATHMDAPWHMVEAGRRLDSIPLSELIGEAVITDVSPRHGPTRDGTSEITAEEIQKSLSDHGHRLRPKDALILYTGWSSLFSVDPSRYYAAYPVVSEAACAWALEAGIRLLGIDAPDVDPPESYSSAPLRPSNHRALLGGNILIIENVGGQVQDLLNERVFLIPAPLKLQGEYASGAPVRLLAERQMQ
jgi:kynurenine formamidase